jgi:hypothetical protein
LGKAVSGLLGNGGEESRRSGISLAFVGGEFGLVHESLLFTAFGFEFFFDLSWALIDVFQSGSVFELTDDLLGIGGPGERWGDGQGTASNGAGFVR